MLRLGKAYSSGRLKSVFGIEPRVFLPMVDGKVVYAAVTRKYNPEAPSVILVGKGPKVSNSAIVFANQNDAIPVFIKRRAKSWEFVGYYRVVAVSTTPDILAEYRARSGRADKLIMVLFLKLAYITHRGDH